MNYELPPKPMLAIPDCSLCGEPAAIEGQTILGDSWAVLCASCWAQIGIPETGRPLVLAAALPRLPGLAHVERYLREAPWVYARTMPQWPHEYVLLRRSPDPWLHLRVLAYIRRHGEQRPWRGRFGRELHSYWRSPGDGREYWTLRPAFTILNRERDAGYPQGRPPIQPA